MATLIIQGKGDRHDRRCTATCYNAKGADCKCVCGGHNHGKGLEQAIENTAEMAQAILEGGAKVPKLPRQVCLGDIVCQRLNGEPVVNIAHRIVRHSPSGFEWGYEGSGPADLALNILAGIIGQQRAEPLYQDFKRDIIARIPMEGGTIKHSQIIEWLAARGIAAA